MILNSVFYNGKAQSSTAGGFGVALIHPIEPLKDPVFMFSRNTYAGIADN